MMLVLKSILLIQMHMLPMVEILFFFENDREKNFFFLGQITEDDEKLLEEETASPANLKRYLEN